MSFVTGAAMRSLEEAAFARGITAEHLMDLAGEGIARRLAGQFPQPGTAVAYVGKGNNGGDALVALRHLRAQDWQVAVRAAWPEPEWGELPRKKLRELGLAPVRAADLSVPWSGPLVLLDGLLGIGAKGGSLREPLATLAREMEDWRENRGAIIAAMDLPSGLDADTGEGDAVTADLTLMVGAPKRGMAMENGVRRSGRVILVPLEDLPLTEDPDLALFCPEAFPGLLTPRPHDFHKGDSGRVGILAGSPGMTGAAVLCASAALHAGAGLVSLHVEENFLPHLAAAMPPEVMIRASANPVQEAFDAGHDALVIGPGIGNAGRSYQSTLLSRLERSTQPAILDADALNLLAISGRLELLRKEHVITPHPGEFKRLAPELAGMERVEAVKAFTERHACTLLLKGARTLVGKPGEAVRFNPTGHAGMASGGQGDVLSGVIGALLGQGLAGVDAAALGAWLCGRAAELCMADGPICVASDTVQHLGCAMRDWREQRR
ncbi:bifunctional ADP-dependent NAD(P)H-hydrate dehydratase/NAD(P)H-hydrate epimerase [Haloferula sp. BvORR071]|uniref:bifunctional ADP-dependent NAD(P)H-hydrate dehydratase/NAD(P)H-hydrate epimerase n=1 Tax=Haloferula sp. BvORR071 TaxID=1396141 RepID=UPI0005564C7F|nr:bifunctional ADP-dependent NAD(P)H-hydrate dehydratase/NAD(P)H-hydrate epimerase [Haloferula sp. BvORR071]